MGGPLAVRVTFAPRTLRRPWDVRRRLFADTEDSDHAEVSPAARDAKEAFTRSRLHRLQDATPLR
jgi:hypothetical protein